MPQTNDLDEKIQKMQALLERWIAWHEGFLRVEPLNDILDDTRTLLKEAKVKHGKG